MNEPTRPIHQPRVEADGSLVAHTVATPTAFKVRARVTVGSRKVMPVIFVPGIMGSNLRARKDLKPEPGAVLKPGESAWRPPSGLVDSASEVRKWSKRPPAQRQRILDPSILEVDPDGELAYSASMLDESEMRERGWGEVHAASYGGVLIDLQRRLDKTYRRGPSGEREVRPYWKRVMQVEPQRWGVRNIQRVTEAELEKYSAYQYPVYAFGYNWLESCEVSGRRLRDRIDQIKKFWTERKHECRHVIIVTHSMGGLVARACARLSQTKQGSASDIAGIIHGVMPALGAPVAYRRIACGTEGGHFTNTLGDNIKADAFAIIAGKSAAETTPVMAFSPGILQLLPNQLYPRPWLQIKTVRTVNRKDEVRDLLALPDGNPYDFYRDMKSWYRMIDPALADPARRYRQQKGGLEKNITAAIDAAERFHTELLVDAATEEKSQPYYHPHTYAFYGADSTLRTYGHIRWVAREPVSVSTALTPANIRLAQHVKSDPDGTREVEIANGLRLSFSVWPQDAHGDETVPVQSGAGPQPHVRQIFAPGGFRHQESYQHDDMLLLTRHLIVKIVQEVK
ncbi:triacylglycerol lipase [Massilia sp. ST3]|uniref:esterase/lipase family protein n=1 Tax=Massilia sp. ST3 TaxID=2824903 RepID=UPI001B8407CC|nr:alpha/beta fold hydrolase [Massilia sp. ST3]MBQ5947728.1 alpha/beta fold hydrolase [Massilia sp. ST3]